MNKKDLNLNKLKGLGDTILDDVEKTVYPQ